MLSANVGANSWNYRVKDLAEAVAAAVPQTKVSINSSAPADARSYKVDFGLFRTLAPDFQPRVRLADSILSVLQALRSINFNDANFRGARRVMRLKAISDLIARGQVSSELRWIRAPAGALAH